MDNHKIVDYDVDPILFNLESFPVEPYDSVNSERIRAHKKHGHRDGGGMERLDPYDKAWWPVVIEEIGEVALAINDKDSIEHMREELVQVAAMVCAWIDSCSRKISCRD